MEKELKEDRNIQGEVSFFYMTGGRQKHITVIEKAISCFVESTAGVVATTLVFVHNISLPLTA